MTGHAVGGDGAVRRTGHAGAGISAGADTTTTSATATPSNAQTQRAPRVNDLPDGGGGGGSFERVYWCERSRETALLALFCGDARVQGLSLSRERERSFCCA